MKDDDHGKKSEYIKIVRKYKVLSVINYPEISDIDDPNNS